MLILLYIFDSRRKYCNLYATICLTAGVIVYFHIYCIFLSIQSLDAKEINAWWLTSYNHNCFWNTWLICSCILVSHLNIFFEAEPLFVKQCLYMVLLLCASFISSTAPCQVDHIFIFECFLPKHIKHCVCFYIPAAEHNISIKPNILGSMTINVSSCKDRLCRNLCVSLLETGWRVADEQGMYSGWKSSRQMFELLSRAATETKAHYLVLTLAPACTHPRIVHDCPHKPSFNFHNP